MLLLWISRGQGQNGFCIHDFLGGSGAFEQIEPGCYGQLLQWANTILVLQVQTSVIWQGHSLQIFGIGTLDIVRSDR